MKDLKNGFKIIVWLVVAVILAIAGVSDFGTALLWPFSAIFAIYIFLVVITGGTKNNKKR